MLKHSSIIKAIQRFGSRARGDAQQNSDYDLLIIKSDITNIIKIEQNIYRKLFGTKANVDIIVRTPELIEENKNIVGSFTRRALEDGILIYENTY